MFDATAFNNSDYTFVLQDGEYYLIDKQMKRVSENLDCDFANSLSDNLFYVIKDGVELIATFVTPDDGAYSHSKTESDSTPSASADNPVTGVVGVALPILLGSAVAAVLARKRK